MGLQRTHVPTAQILILLKMIALHPLATINCQHSVEESVGGKFIKLGGSLLTVGVKVGAVLGILIFIAGAWKLHQIRTQTGAYSQIPEGGDVA